MSKSLALGGKAEECVPVYVCAVETGTKERRMPDSCSSSSLLKIMWEHACLLCQLLPPALVPISLTHMSQGQFVLGPQLF